MTDEEMGQLDAYLAKARGWEPRVWYPRHSHPWPVVQEPPSPTRNATDALELLDWLAEKPRGWRCQAYQFDDPVRVVVDLEHSQTGFIYTRRYVGQPSEALPKAITLVARDAIEAMKESEVRGEG